MVCQGVSAGQLLSCLGSASMQAETVLMATLVISQRWVTPVFEARSQGVARPKELQTGCSPTLEFACGLAAVS